MAALLIGTLKALPVNALPIHAISVANIPMGFPVNATISKSPMVEPLKLKNELGGSVTTMVCVFSGASRPAVRPMARRSMFTQIQNGLMRPATTDRLPLWSHTKPESP